MGGRGKSSQEKLGGGPHEEVSGFVQELPPGLPVHVILKELGLLEKMATQPQPRLTLEEYLEQEQASPVLHEFHSGEVWEIEAASLIHERICVQTTASLLQTFPPTCEVYGSKLSIYIESEDLAVYPDAVVVCGLPQTIQVKGSPLAVTNPLLIVEVLSPSTQDYDRGFKNTAYRTIPSLRHLIFVAQDRVLVEHLQREELDRWSITSYREVHQKISLGDDSLSLAAIYARVEFPLSK